MAIRVRKAGPLRRAEIARAALDIIGRRGLSALTTTELARSIGLSSGALFRHFPSREAILDEAERQADARITATFPDERLPPLRRLRALAESRIALLSSEPGLAWLLSSRQAALALPPTAVERLGALVKRSRGFIRQALLEAIAAGDVRADVPLPTLLVTFTATVHALISAPSAQSQVTASAHPVEILDGLFQLLAPPTSGPHRRPDHAND